jgi:prefoldin alpha subunit
MNQDELRQALMMLDMYKAQLETLAGQIQILQYSVEEVARARETISKIAEAAEDDEILMPVGANSFVYAKVASNSKALIGIGTKLSVEKDMSDAVKTMDSNLEEITQALKEVTGQSAELEARAKQLSSIVQQEYQKLQEQGP